MSRFVALLVLAPVVAAGPLVEVQPLPLFCATMGTLSAGEQVHTCIPEGWVCIPEGIAGVVVAMTLFTSEDDAMEVHWWWGDATLTPTNPVVFFPGYAPCVDGPRLVAVSAATIVGYTMVLASPPL